MSLEKLGDFYKSANNNTTSGITGNGTSSPLGVDEDSYSVYNEKCLFSSIYSCQTGALSDDFTKYQRLRLRVGWHNNSTTTNEGDSYIEVTPEPTAGANVAAIWNVGTGTPGYICVGRINFPTTTSFNGTVGKLMQFNDNAGNTGWEGRLRPIKEVWGINKQLYKFFGLDSEGGSLQSNKTLGYRGDTATLTVTPSGDEWKCSAINITGAELTGNDFMFGNSNVTAQAEFEHSRDLTLVPNEHATLSADKMSGFSGDIVTVDATTDEGWYFTGLNITGATATGNQFMFVGENVTAEGLYTDAGYPITYIVETGGSLTGDQIYIPGSTGITLETSYDPYYRFSGYEVTGGTITDNVLVAEGPCTAKAVYKVNYFTATGNFNFATGAAWAGVASWSRNCDGIIRARTGSLPSEWGSNGSNFNPSDASSYKINWNTTLYFQSNNLNKGSKAMTGYNRIYCGTTNVKTTTCTIAGSKTGNYAKANTNNNGNSTIQGHPYMNAAIGSTTSRVQMDCNSCSPNGWTATGIAP